MKSNVKYVLPLLMVMLLACKRQSLVQPYDDRVSVEVSVDWSESGLPDGYANNFSVLFYPEGGGVPYTKVAEALSSTHVLLPVGRYSVLLFNDFIGDLAGIEFVDDESYEAISAKSVLSDVSSQRGYYYQRGEGERVAMDHDRLAAWRLDSFEITANVECGYCCPGYDAEVEQSAELVNLQPTPVTAMTTITLGVENLDNAMTIEGALKGMATAATLSTNERHSSVGAGQLYIVSFLSRDYNSGSSVDGTTTAELVTFGKQPDDGAEYELELNIVLNSGELVTFTRGVTEQVLESEDFDIVIDLTDEGDIVVLPESQGTGFGVEGWGDSNSETLM